MTQMSRKRKSAVLAFWDRVKSRQQRTTRRKPRLEPMEPRILLSADLPLTPASFDLDLSSSVIDLDIAVKDGNVVEVTSAGFTQSYLRCHIHPWWGRQ